MFIYGTNPSNSPGGTVGNVSEGFANDVDIEKCSINVTFIRTVELVLDVVRHNSSDDEIGDFGQPQQKIFQVREIDRIILNNSSVKV